MMLQSICERLLVLFYQFQPVNQGTAIQRWRSRLESLEMLQIHSNRANQDNQDLHQQALSKRQDQ